MDCVYLFHKKVWLLLL